MFCGVVSHLSVSWTGQLYLLSQAWSRLQVSRPLAISEEVRWPPKQLIALEILLHFHGCCGSHSLHPCLQPNTHHTEKRK